MGTEFHFGMMERLWSQIVVTVVQQCECTLIPQNCTLKNGKSDTYVLTTIKKKSLETLWQVQMLFVYCLGLFAKYYIFYGRT